MYCGLPMFFRPNQRGWITLKARHVDNSKPFTMIGSMILNHSPWLFSWFKVIHNDCFHDSEPFTVIVFTIHSYSKWLFSWFYAIHRDCFYESKLFTNHHDCFHDSKHEFFRKIQYPMVVPHDVMPKLLRIGIDWSTILLATERIFSLPLPPPPLWKLEIPWVAGTAHRSAQLLLQYTTATVLHQACTTVTAGSESARTVLRKRNQSGLWAWAGIWYIIYYTVVTSNIVH